MVGDGVVDCVDAGGERLQGGGLGRVGRECAKGGGACAAAQHRAADCRRRNNDSAYRQERHSVCHRIASLVRTGLDGGAYAWRSYAISARLCYRVCAAYNTK